MKRFLTTFPVLLLAITLGGCDLVGDILEFGFWVLVILVVVIALLIWWIARLVRGRATRRPPRP